jgi:4-alpha-glucanotransferase
MSADGSLPARSESAVAEAFERLSAVRFGREICGDLAAAEGREWWIGNGRGAYGAGTLALSLTRRNHGLLIAPVDPPLGRALVFAKADAELVVGARRLPLYTNRWASGVVAPAGHLTIESFHLDGSIPVWRFAVGGWQLEQRIWMEQGAPTTHLAWRLLSAPPGPSPRLSVAVMANGRDHHGETWMAGFSPLISAVGDALMMRVPDRFTLQIQARGGRIAEHRQWIENFDLPVERERGLPDRDHHLLVGRAELPLAVGVWHGIVASLDPNAPTDIAAALERRRVHDRRVLDRADAADPVYAEAPGWVRRLVLASDLYVIDRSVAGVEDGRSVIAGYPWFGDWGRDTMIALPGLALATGRFADARNILETFARFVDRGMLPNVFPGTGDRAEYNTADAALWYIEAWRRYVDATGDRAALDRAFPVLRDIVEWHQRGTRYGIVVDPADGLLRAGEPGVQLTWMDAKIGDWVVTPRIGKPVEINSLWHNALAAIAQFAEQLGHRDAPHEAAADHLRTSFARFVRPDGGGLYDVIDGPQGDDPTIRPNQILAVSLPVSPLDPTVQRRVLDECAEALLTSCGLRSLAPGHRDYRGQYLGGVVERDGSYHQGRSGPGCSVISRSPITA